MDLAQALERKELVANAPVSNPVTEISDSERKRIITDLLTKGRYTEMVKIDLGDDVTLEVTFQTRTAKEELTIREELEKNLPKLVTDLLFKQGLYMLVYSLVSINGTPVMFGETFEERLNELLDKLPQPLLAKLIEELMRFEQKVLLAIDPNFLQKLQSVTQKSGQESNTFSQSATEQSQAQ